ncbi:MAG TPA: serine/threonine-protein kinase [Ktedonosporobacter sp.]|nr:serine/threonine-protein kinase [Ktedonosporobacter sp.]
MWLEGYQLDRYRMVRLLGYGGMGAVYLAEDEEDGQSSEGVRQVAVKVIQTGVEHDDNIQATEATSALFDREIGAIAQFDHPHILSLLDYGERQIGNTKILYLVTPFQQEGSLAQWINSPRRVPQRNGGGWLSPQWIASIVLQAASALQYAHDRQMMHQGVKPANFLMCARQEALPDVLLTDFGMAQLATFCTGQFLHGSSLYMAPEQWQGQPVLASDQYALAVLAYELLTGRPPFQGTPVHSMYQHLTVSPMSPCLLVPQLHLDVDRTLLRALAKRPDDRFPSIMAFAQALQVALQTTRPRIYAVRESGGERESNLGLIAVGTGIVVSQGESGGDGASIKSNEGELQAPALVACRAEMLKGCEHTPPIAVRSPATPAFFRSEGGISGRMWSVQPGMSAQPMRRPLRQSATILATPLPARQRVTVLFARWPQHQRVTILSARQPLHQRATVLCERWLLRQKAHVLAACQPLHGRATVRFVTSARLARKRNVLLLMLIVLWLLGSGAMFLMAAMKERERVAATQATVTAQAATDVAVQNHLTATSGVATITAQTAAVTATAQAEVTTHAYATATAQANAAMTTHARAIALAKSRAMAIERTRTATQAAQHNAPTATVRARPAAGNAVTILGTPSPNNYCQQNEYGTAVVTGSSAYSWACETGAGQPIAISMLDVCRWQFHNTQALDVLVDMGNPDSWECITNVQKLGALTAADMTDYCQSIGSSGVSLDGSTSYDWHCVTADGQHGNFDVNGACRWQFNNAQALGRPANEANPDSWECWAGL